MSQLGQFLRHRRAQLLPDDVGLTPYNGRRRVPGLRREELAQLAGVSVAYYTRLEQGLSRNASDGVLAAIARALRLDENEAAYLHDLARPARAGRARPQTEQVRPALRTLVGSVEQPAYVVSRYSDVLAWNGAAHALLAGHLDRDAPDHAADRPNLSRLLFLDPRTRTLYADWRRRAGRTVASLRATAARRPSDPRLAALIRELTTRSPEFGALWSEQRVHRCSFGIEEFRHPVAGPLSLHEEVLNPPEDDDQQVVVLTPAPGSPSEAALARLGAEVLS
jgi:transcriptional regulator with XRE-family HTH domain